MYQQLAYGMHSSLTSDACHNDLLGKIKKLGGSSQRRDACETYWSLVQEYPHGQIFFLATRFPLLSIK